MHELGETWTWLEGWLARDRGLGVSLVVWSLAWVFAIAGVAKIRRPLSTAFALTDFRVTRRVRPPLGTGLGMLELALAVGLASQVATRQILVVACLLLGTFCVLIAAALVRGERFACYCFGGEESLSRATLARTALLAGVAAGALLASEHVATPPASDRVFGAVAGLAVVSTLAVASHFAALIRMNRDVFTVAAR